MGLKFSVAKINSCKGQDVADAIDSIVEFCESNGITPKIGLSAMLLLLVSDFKVNECTERQFLDIMQAAFRHYDIDAK